MKFSRNSVSTASRDQCVVVTTYFASALLLLHQGFKSSGLRYIFSFVHNILSSLAACKADVFIQNFRPGAMERSGLGYDDLISIVSTPLSLHLLALNTSTAYGDLQRHGCSWVKLVERANGCMTPLITVIESVIDLRFLLRFRTNGPVFETPHI